MRHRPLDCRQRGFSLIELLVAVAVVGILSAIAFPAYDHYINKSRIRSAQVDLVALSMVIEAGYQRAMAFPEGEFKGTSAVMRQFDGWRPSERAFSYSVSSLPGGYRAKARGAGLSGSARDCNMSIDEKGVRRGDCPHGGGRDWK
ncbi:hypothetical protein DK254_26535 [Pseudomonas sp. RW407]|uniref:type IV pilin protein n=1 Tax=Pseudomonas sp. RW407 TaxID=2202894 RepID=UPI000D6F1E0B|nr:prepilin-type N-terminal cleavage/methylation domain-containing protein [Pseudomonas sp. RW407]PWU26164.1 hypothetical protein DK254_26535 [Pseudomonas sp. RW407]